MKSPENWKKVYGGEIFPGRKIWLCRQPGTFALQQSGFYDFAK